MTSPLLEEFREQLYQLLPQRRDAVLNLIDARCSEPGARSVVELSLSPWFRRQWGSVFDAIEHLVPGDTPAQQASGRRELQKQIAQALAPALPGPHAGGFYLWGVDVTPCGRPYALTLEDRRFVHQATPVPGQRPITVGHAYSQVALLPEKQEGDPPWLVPLRVDRVASDQSSHQVGAQQLKDLLQDEALPFHQKLNLGVGDTDYSKIPFLGELLEQKDLVIGARVAANRVFYRQPEPLPEDQPKPAHRPCWYGEPFKLKDDTTWGDPDEQIQLPYVTRAGRCLTAHLQGWHELLMRGTCQVGMHQHPFTLVRIRLLDENGKAVFERDLWLILIGDRRAEISLRDLFWAYRQRFDLEHYFRFGKQKLLADDFQTPLLEHEENWWLIVQLAYQQLWLARELATALPRPWERPVPQQAAAVASPAQVQRAFGALIGLIGTPAQDPKPRGKSSGRPKGTTRPARKRAPIVRKSKKARKKRRKKAA